MSRAWPILMLLPTSLFLMTSGCARDAMTPGPIEVRQVFGGFGTSPGRFGYPRAIESDGSTIWIVDKTGRVQGLGADGGDCRVLWEMPIVKAGKPVGITIAPAPDGEPAFYIPDTHYHRVLIYRNPLPTDEDDRRVLTPEEIHIASFGEYGMGDGQFIYPTDVAVRLEDGLPDRLFVGEYGGNDRISVFRVERSLDGEESPQFVFEFAFGVFGGGTDPEAIEFDRPQALVFETGLDELIVADSRNHRLGRFTPTGELIGWIGEAGRPGSEPGSFNYPYGIAPLGDGTVFVVEYGNNRVQRIAIETGESLGVWGEPGHGPGQLNTPWSAAVSEGTTFILDSGNNRVLTMTTPRRRR